MLMKMFSPRTRPKGLSRSKAWLYAALNQLAFPGAGTVMAGRRIGYFQAAVMVTGFVLTMFYLLAVIVNQVRYATQGSTEDQLRAAYQQNTWAGKTGAILCLFAWCWSLVSTIIFLSTSRREPPFLPPRSALH